MRENRKLYPFVIPIHHQPSEEHKKARLEMCRKFAVKIDENGRWINDVWFFDEAHFYLNGTVSTKNSRFWGITPPPELHQQPLHSRKCTAWCALSARGIIGPFWFEDEEGRAASVTQVNYRDVIGKFCGRLGNNRKRAWLQQDGAPPHTARLTMMFLRDQFGAGLISNGAELQLAPHSPDLSVLDFFLWGYVKSQVYQDRPQDILQLKDAITNFMGILPADMCARAFERFRERAEEFIRRRGGHFEHQICSLFHKTL